MSRTRLHIDSQLSANSEFELTGDAARYIGRVLRLGPNDDLTVFDGRGGEYPATILSQARNSIRLAIAEHIDRDVESPLGIHLLQGISRGERMDVVVQKATELGVQRITPLITEYSVVKLEAKRAGKRLRHWRGIATSACEQSGRNIPPEIDSPQPLRTWLGENIDSSGTRLILKPGDKCSIRSIDSDIQQLTLLIGPEGGFSDAEYDLAEVTGFHAVGFGPRILRTETAAIAVIAALQTLLGDLATNNS
jgi:16S rRNA (uracil1498-N3)-methyltransferase